MYWIIGIMFAVLLVTLYFVLTFVETDFWKDFDIEEDFWPLVVLPIASAIVVGLLLWPAVLLIGVSLAIAFVFNKTAMMEKLKKLLD